MTEETLFELALNTPTADRAALLDRECAGDPALRTRVEALLAAHEVLGALAHQQPVSATAAPPGDAPEPSLPGESTAPPDDRPAEGVGALLAGKYKLVEEIGEGGMGSVFMAQQTAPVRRAVAVKVIKAGMDTRAVLARFDAERQALAMMDHPNIARVLDAGTTESGRPFFVMELVKGVPINRFCDERRLTLHQRLELFVPVCQAIQHAHQKGVIHRDIKPSNVLVALYDDRPVPKVIDFGIAKATGAQLTEQTLMTGFGDVVGTPEYMSPEQATLNNLDIDTRSDVYALGVLLYELLTGTTPVDRKSLGRAAVLEVLRIVREVEPPAPSSRLSTLEALPSIAANRNTEPARLAGLLRGELDWVVMKALEKDRSQRYDSANALARDVQRYLADELVEARPHSTGYRLRNFVRRHRGQVMAAALVLLALVAGIIGTSWGLVRAARALKAEAARAEGERLAKLNAQEQKAKAEAANVQAQKRLEQIQKGNEILTRIFADLDIRRVKEEGKPLEAVLADRLVQAAEQLEGESVGDPLAVAALQDRLGRSLLSLGFAPQAIPVFEKSLATRKAELGPDHSDTVTAMNNLAAGYRDAGRLDRALPLFEDVLRQREAKLGSGHPDTLTNMGNLAIGYQDAGRLDRALPLFEDALRLSKAKLGPDHPETLTLMSNLATGYLDTGKYDRALPLLEDVLRQSEAKLGPDHPETLSSINNLALSYQRAGKLDRALPLFEETLRLTKAKLGPDHPHTVTTMNNLAAGYREAGKLDRALPLFEGALQQRRVKLGPDHPQTLSSMGNLAVGYLEARKLDRALPLLEEALPLSKAKLGHDHPETLIIMGNLAGGYREAHRLDRSVPLFEEALRLQEEKLGRSHPATLVTVANLGANYKDAGRLNEALPLLEEAHRASRKIPTLRWVGATLLDGYAKAGQSAEAAVLVKELLADVRKSLPEGSPQLAGALAQYGSVLLQLKAFAEAEPLLRECLASRGKAEPDAWSTFNARSLLGGVLLGQKKYAEAEPLLLQGYEGLKAREKAIPPPAATRLPEALDRLIELYTATNKPDEVKKWRAERARYDKGSGSKPGEKK
jgi:serine/threonine protein kinase